MKILSPSILAADLTKLGDDVAKVASAGAQLLHVDIMDGHFVPNITFGPATVKALRKATDLTLDVHLMIDDPERYAEKFIEAGADILTFHVEAVEKDKRIPLLKKIAELGAVPAVSIKPATPIGEVFDLFPHLGMILVMTVEPGFGGQKLIPEALAKVPELKKAINESRSRVLIEIDGGVTMENAAHAASVGTDIIVAGSSVFGAENPADAAAEMLKLINN